MRPIKERRHRRLDRRRRRDYPELHPGKGHHGMIEKAFGRLPCENAAHGDDDERHHGGHDIFHSARARGELPARLFAAHRKSDRRARRREDVAEIVYAVGNDGDAVGVNAAKKLCKSQDEIDAARASRRRYLRPFLFLARRGDRHRHLRSYEKLA